MSFSSNKVRPNNIDLTSSQTLSNKTLDSSTTIDSGVTLTTPSIESPTRLDPKKDTFANLTAYAASAQNGELVYATDVKTQYQVKDGALVLIGSSSGGFNYIKNGLAEVDASNWTLYANTAVGIRPDDFGGTPAGLTFTRETVNPLINTAHFKLSKDAVNRQGQGVYTDFSNETAHATLKMLLSMFVDSSHANLADADLAIYLVGSSDSFVTNFQVIEPNNPDLLAGVKQIQKQLQFLAADLDYRLCIHVKSVKVTTYDLLIDEVGFGPKSAASGAVVTDWQDYTPTFTGFGVVSLINIKYRRVGSNVEVSGYFDSGTTAAIEAQMTLPSGLVIGTGNAFSQGIGSFFRDNSNSNTFSVLGTDGDQFVNFSLNLNATYNNISPVNGNVAFPNGSRASIEFSVPIFGWSSNARMSEDLGGREIEFIHGLVGTQSIPTGVVTKVQFNDTINKDTVSGWNGVDEYIVQETGFYDCKFGIEMDGNNTGFRDFQVGNKSIKFFPAGTLSTGKLYINGNVTVYKTKGQSIYATVNQSSGGNLNIGGSGSTYNYMMISRNTSSQTILENETVAARYTSNSGQSIGSTTTAVIYEDLEEDTHNGYNPLTGDYTIPISGRYLVAATILQSVPVSYTLMDLRVNGIIFQTRYLDTSGSNEDGNNSVVGLKYFNRGDVIDVFATLGSTNNLTTSSSHNNFSIVRIK